MAITSFQKIDILNCMILYATMHAPILCIYKIGIPLLKQFMSLSERQSERMEDTQRYIASISWFSPQIVATAGVEPIQSQETEASS